MGRSESDLIHENAVRFAEALKARIPEFPQLVIRAEQIDLSGGPAVESGNPYVLVYWDLGGKKDMTRIENLNLEYDCSEHPLVVEVAYQLRERLLSGPARKSMSTDEKLDCVIELLADMYRVMEQFAPLAGLRLETPEALKNWQEQRECDASSLPSA